MAQLRASLGGQGGGGARHDARSIEREKTCADQSTSEGYGDMTIFSSRLSRSLVTGILVLGGFLSASPSHVLAAGDDTHVCKGTPAAPGVLKADSYESVVVEGFCAVSQGVAVVKGDVTVRSGGVLGAIFALNDYSNRGHSRLIVRGDLSIEKGATAFLGCDPQEFPCLDDPNLNSPTLQPTLQTSFEVDGNITTHSALGVVIHHGTIGGNLVVTGGGRGTSCTPTGVFAANGKSRLHRRRVQSH
jgi:hypothetical protein